MEQRPHITFTQQLAQFDPCGVKAQLVVDDRELIRRGLRCRKHRLRLSDIEGRRFLADHMFAGLERTNCNWCM